MSLVVDLIGQRSRSVIGRLSVSRDVIVCEDCKKVRGSIVVKCLSVLLMLSITRF